MPLSIDTAYAAHKASQSRADLINLYWATVEELNRPSDRENPDEEAADHKLMRAQEDRL